MPQRGKEAAVAEAAEEPSAAPAPAPTAAASASAGATPAATSADSPKEEAIAAKPLASADGGGRGCCAALMRSRCCGPALGWLADAYRGFNGARALGPDGAPLSPEWCPEQQAGLASRLFFAYANGLVAKGAAKHLEQADLWTTAAADEPRVVWERFEAALAATATPAGAGDAAAAGAGDGDTAAAGADGAAAAAKPPPAPRGVLWRALLRVHGRTLVVTGLIKLVHDAIMFSQPYILEQLLRHLSSTAASGGAAAWGRPERLTSLGLAFAMLGAAVLEPLTINVYFNALFKCSLHVKTQLLEMLYRKSLRVSGAVKARMGTGAIVNLQSNDAAKMWMLPGYVHMIWNGPFQIIVVMLLLIRVLSVWPALAGLAVTVAIIPATMVVGKLLAKTRRVSMAAADARVKLITEVVTGALSFCELPALCFL